MALVCSSASSHYAVGTISPAYALSGPCWLSVWFKANNASATEIVSAMWRNGASDYFRSIITGGNVQGGWRPAGSAVDNGAAYSTGVWNNLIFTVGSSGTPIECYMNNSSAGSSSGINASFNASRIIYGASDSAGNIFNGKIAYGAFGTGTLTSQNRIDLQTMAPSAVSGLTLLYAHPLVSNGTASYGGVDVTAQNGATFDSDTPLATGNRRRRFLCGAAA